MDDRKTLSVLRGHSLRELVDKVNTVNRSSDSGMVIRKDDIVSIFKESDTYFMLYYN